jgi:hypothetical protein
VVIYILSMFGIPTESVSAGLTHPDGTKGNANGQNKP